MARGDHLIGLIYEAAITPRLWTQALAALADAVGCLDIGGRVIDQSAAGAAILTEAAAMRIGAGGRISARRSEDTRRLHALIIDAASGGRAGVLRLGGVGDAPVVAEVTRAGVRADNPFDPRRAACALIFISRPRARPRIDAGRLRIALGCSRVEAEVTAALARSRSPRQIAQDRGVSLNTVRSQIRALYVCTGARRLAELSARLATM